MTQLVAYISIAQSKEEGTKYCAPVYLGDAAQNVWLGPYLFHPCNCSTVTIINTNVANAIIRRGVGFLRGNSEKVLCRHSNTEIICPTELVLDAKIPNGKAISVAFRVFGSHYPDGLVGLADMQNLDHDMLAHSNIFRFCLVPNG